MKNMYGLVCRDTYLHWCVEDNDTELKCNPQVWFFSFLSFSKMTCLYFFCFPDLIAIPFKALWICLLGRWCEKHSVNVIPGRCQGPEAARGLCPMCSPLCCLALMAEFTVALSLTIVRSVSNSHKFHSVPLNSCPLFTRASTSDMRFL